MVIVDRFNKNKILILQKIGIQITIFHFKIYNYNKNLNIYYLQFFLNFLITSIIGCSLIGNIDT